MQSSASLMAVIAPAVLGLSLLLITTAQARSIHYGAIDNADLLACDTLDWGGQSDLADSCYKTLLQQNTDPAIQAEARWALGDIKGANSLFQAAVKQKPDDATVRLRWGELYMQTYQYQDAFDLYSEALQIEPDNAFANVGASRALVERFEADAVKYLDPVLGNNAAPAGARLQATLILARLAMEASDMDGATAQLKLAEQIANEAGLPLLEVYALYATMDLLLNNKDSAWIKKAQQINPVWGDLYAIPGYFFWISRRYREAIELYAEAVRIQPDNWIAHMELGINLLRNNEVTRAREHLQIAYQGDPYNPKTVNTLRLLDTFVDFDLLNRPEKSAANMFPKMTMRLHKDESGVLVSYAEKLAGQGIDEFTRRYRFEPKEPVVIEIYPNHDDFVVRTIGMPGVGILGATFGYVFAMDSPSDHPENEYHWGTTLWHELAHVFTLEVTDHMIPRWFSEGISVYEEWRYGPIKGVRIPINVYEAMVQQKFLPIADLDTGFIRPTYDEQVIVSYMQAGLVCDFIDQTYGFNKINDMLEQFRQGKNTATVIESVFGIAPTDFDGQFDNWLRQHHGEVLRQLDQWKELQKESVQAFMEEDWDSVIEPAEAAIALFPEYVEADSPYVQLAQAYAATDAVDNELKTLLAFWQRGGFVPEALWKLANILYSKDRKAEAIDVLYSINWINPFNTELHATLGDWMLEAGNTGQALTEYQVLLAMKPHDLADAHYRVARANHLLDRDEEARTHLLSALEIAPHFRPAQKLLLETTQTQNQIKQQ